MRLSIEATLFRPEQADPFFDSVQSYRDRRVWLSLGNAWLELEKERHDPEGENIPYKVVGASVPGEGSLPERVLRLFNDRYVPVEVGSAASQKLPAIEPLGTKKLSFEMSQMYERKQGPSRENPAMLLQNIPLWRPQQLQTFSFLIDSYYDRSIELCLSAGEKKAYLLLNKSGSADDKEPPHLVAGHVAGDIDIFSFVSKMFPREKDQPAVKAYATKIISEYSWTYFKHPMPLNHFASVVSFKYDELKR
jgi:hypothetical protein